VVEDTGALVACCSLHFRFGMRNDGYYFGKSLE
jgi:hypothetical protein